MKLLSLSLDPQILNTESVVASRNVRYGEVLDMYTIVVPSSDSKIVTLSSNTTVYGTGGRHKAVQLYKLCILALSLVRKNKYDVITSQDTYFLGLLGFILSRLYHTGLEVQVLGIEKLNFFRKKLAQFTLSHAGSIRVLSLGLKKRLLNEFGINEDRMMLVPIYVDVSSLGLSNNLDAAKQTELNINKEAFRREYAGRFNIVSVQRLVPIKNISMQLQAVATLKGKFPQILLHIVGDGPDREMLQKMIADFGIEAHVILHGPKFGTELSTFFTQCDCFVLTSNFEGYGMVIVEAATAGACIVMTDVGCAGEVILDEKSGLIVPPFDTAAFTQALQRILLDEPLRVELRGGALKSIAELPSFDMVLEKYKASWQQAFANKK